MSILNKQSFMWAFIAILWIVCIVLGTANYYVVGMCLGVVLIFLHLLLGVSKEGIVSKKFLRYPLLIWMVLWVASFILSAYFSNKFLGQTPSFTILGFHPSFAPTVFLYWIGGQLTLNVGHYIYQDEWLSESDWEKFSEEAKKIRGGEI